MRQAGRYLPEYRQTRARAGSFLDLCYTPELAVEVSLQPIRRFGFDAAILFSDILVIPDALGQQVRFEENTGPVLSPPVTSGEAISRLRPEGVIGHLAPVFETLRMLKHKLSPQTALIGFAGAPWTVASYMVAGEGIRDQAPARAFAYRDPEGFARLIDMLAVVTADYLIAQVEAGAEVLQLFDTWAGALPELEFRRWCLLPARQIIRLVHARYPDVPVIGFPRGAGPLYLDFCRETGVEGISIDTAMPLNWAREHLQPQVTVQGNLDPLLLVAGGLAMRNEALRILQTFGGARFIFNLGHGIVPQTPLQHVAELVSLVKDWRG